SLYCCSDGVRGRGAAVTYLSHRASFHSSEWIAPSNRGIKHLGSWGVRFLQVVFGIFAHDEERNLSYLLDDLQVQDILVAPDIKVEIHVLANGCFDRTFEFASRHELAEILSAQFLVHDLSESGKSRTWNRFVHEIAPPTADMLGFLDADIRISDPGHLSGLVRQLVARPDLKAFVSHPVPDASGATTMIARAILRGSGSSGNWRRSICGQCYLMPGPIARDMHLPLGLPVEDGFLSAMLRTDCMENLPGTQPIDGDPEISHVFEPERTLRGFLRHQMRIIIGGALNAALFTSLREAPDGYRRQILAKASEDSGWVGQQLKSQLPRRWYGWVPPHFLFKRTRNMLANLHRPRDFLRIPRIVAYFGLDLLVYLRAQLRMALGTGANFW
ncbi:glycosyltransferase family 2 protein, partial [Tropicimonas sp. IMCC6043]|uniref:glycosyltransferase n=1 Tax=Tropicimonas sp. IMCC6043 TaxID=2510645 RepID=UPI001A9133C6